MDVNNEGFFATQPKEPEQKPFGYTLEETMQCWDLGYAAAVKDIPRRTWVGLTDEQKHQLNQSLNLQGRFPIIDAIEAICKGNNT